LSVIILDTNVLSALMRDAPDQSVASWIDRQPQSSIWTNSITILEIQTGLQVMPAGKKRVSLSEDFERLLDRIEHRIAVFDEQAARLAAELTGLRQKKGRVGELRDTMIAGIVLSHHASLATRNTARFSDISATVVNPWDA
jgi:predicted nucleic acid-binding protein